MKVGLSREDALCRSEWSVGVNLIAAIVVVEVQKVKFFSLIIVTSIFSNSESPHDTDGIHIY